MKAFLRRLFSFGFRYGFVSLVVMFLTLSLATNQFPPPITETFRAMKELKGLMNVSQSTAKIAAAKKSQDQILKEIEGEDKLSENNCSKADHQQTSDRVKSLEYEVALLKSKLNRAAGEARELRKVRQASVQK